jgi:hypothetical protein
VVARHWLRASGENSETLLSVLEATFGQAIRLHYGEVLALLTEDDQLTQKEREFVRTQLDRDPLRGKKPVSSTIDELFTRTIAFRSSDVYLEALSFVSRFKEYAPFNNMLVFLQRPTARYWTTATDWKRRFGREVKEEAIPIVILRPRGPVMLVYELLDTRGTEVPPHILNPFHVEGEYSRHWFGRLVTHAADDGIEVHVGRLGGKLAGRAQRRAKKEAHFVVELNRDHREAEAFVTLCHELAHIYLGHLGPGPRGAWPSRLGLRRTQTELEAESAAHVVALRLGLRTLSAEYLAGYARSRADYAAVSVEMITKVAGRIQRGAVPMSPT